MPFCRRMGSTLDGGSHVVPFRVVLRPFRSKLEVPSSQSQLLPSTSKIRLQLKLTTLELYTSITYLSIFANKF